MTDRIEPVKGSAETPLGGLERKPSGQYIVTESLSESLLEQIETRTGSSTQPNAFWNTVGIAINPRLLLEEVELVIHK